MLLGLLRAVVVEFKGICFGQNSISGFDPDLDLGLQFGEVCGCGVGVVGETQGGHGDS